MALELVRRGAQVAAIDRVFPVNWLGTLYLNKAFLPVPGQTIYGASKAAVKRMTEGLHSGVEMPKMDSPLVQKQAGHTYPADKAARDIVEGMETNRFRVLVGNDSKFVDLMYRLSPRRAAAFIADKMKGLLTR